MRQSFFRFAGLKFLVLCLVFVSLFAIIGLTPAVAYARERTTEGSVGPAQPIPGMQCRKVALVQGGRVMETMLVCSKPGVVRRLSGVTEIVARLGSRVAS